MAAIEWDKIGERYYETGTDHGVLYPYDAKQKAYANGVAWNGLTAVTASPSGAEPSPIYADNIKYVNMMSAEEFGGTIEAYTYPDEFEKCDGSFYEGGVSIGQQKRIPFGFSWRTRIGNDTEGNDHAYKIHVAYSAMAQPSEKSYATVNDSPEAVTLSWSFTTTPESFKSDGNFKDLKPTAYITFDSRRMDAETLKAVEAALYGTSSKEPTLPSLDELLALAGLGDANPETGAAGDEETP